MNRQIRFICLGVIFSLSLLPGCSTRPDPRNTINKFITAVDQSDTTFLAEHLDFQALLEKSLEGFLEKDKEELFPQLRQQLLTSFTNDGLTRMHWKSNLIVVGKSEVAGDSATVEVTYLNKSSGTRDYTRIGLFFKDGKWKIYNLKL
ncbi:MAG: hypothetical protein OEV55_02050 [candidate division Zixibacteria bacterium]|nr:hypothetical protein [candidate division Zixibacteria bacterium]